MSLAVNEGAPIQNQLMRGSLKIIKTFEGLTTPIAGVPFHIIGKTEVGVTVELTAKTNADGEILLEKLPVGEYVVTELESPLTEGYLLSPAENAIVAQNQIAAMTIHNKRIYGALRVLKLDADTNEPLAGALFGLYQDGKLLCEALSDANGLVLFDRLPFGAYEVKEISAPGGYKLSAQVLAATIDAAQQHFDFTLTNEKEPNMPAPTPMPQPPKTGDESKLRLWLGLLGVSAAGLLGYRRKRKTGLAESAGEVPSL